MRQIAVRLVERGHQVTVATGYLRERKSEEIDGVKIATFRASGNLVRGLSGEIDAYRNYVLRGEYDVFMVKAAQQWTFDALIPVLERIHKPKIFVPCGFSGLYEPAYADYYGRMPDWMSTFDQLVFYATDYRDINLARERGLERLTIIPNGASEREFQVQPDPAFRQRLGVAEDAFVALTVGNLSGLKGHRELAEAFTLARFDGAPAVLILNGNRPARAAGTLRAHAIVALRRAGLGWLLTALGAKPSLESLVERISRAAPGKRAMIVDLPRAELVQAYLNSDLFVFASNVEYSPLVLFEAAAAGLPFLSVPVGNAEEIARWTGAGEICSAPRDAKGYTRVETGVLADRMAALASDHEKRRRMGETGRANWLERFTWATIADQYEALFERVIAEKSLNAGANRRAVAPGGPEAAA
jgi:L-malate glycosyltransferase